MDFFLDQDAWIAALAFAFLMLAGWRLGAKVRTLGASKEGGSTRIEDGSLALFGLLLAFCFSGAAGHYEARKELLRRDAIAISEFVTVSSMLEDADRQALHEEVARYVDRRLAFGGTRLDDPGMPRILKADQENLARMQSIVRRVIENKSMPSIHAPLLNAFNGVTEAHDNRLYGVQDRVNGSIVMMLVVFGVFTTFTMGRLHAAEGTTGLPRIAAYIFLVSLVFFVTIDMEQPRRGLHRVSQSPMQDLKASMNVQQP